MVEPSLDDVGRRLDDLQREATHNRMVVDVQQSKMRSLRSKMDMQISELQVQRGLLNLHGDELHQLRALVKAQGAALQVQGAELAEHRKLLEAILHRLDAAEPRP